MIGNVILLLSYLTNLQVRTSLIASEIYLKEVVALSFSSKCFDRLFSIKSRNKKLSF